MKAILLSIALLTQLFYTNKASAENPDSSSLSIKRFRIGFDILKPWAHVSRTRGEATHRIKFEILSTYQVSARFAASLDLGYGQGVFDIYNGAQQYKSKGFYAKPGFEYNILSDREVKTSNMSFSLGYRLGLSAFSEKNQYVFHSNFWNSDNVEENNWKSFGYWHEFLAPIRGVLFRTEKHAFSLGFTPRLRVKPRKADHTQLFIPGYGGNDPFNIAMNIDFAIGF